jgi:hypothetical protein
MTTIDLTGPFNDLDNTQVSENCKPVRLADLMASALMAGSEGDPIKYLDWAIELKKTGIINVDNADRDHLHEMVKNHKGLTNLMKGRLMRGIKPLEPPKAA